MYLICPFQKFYFNKAMLSVIISRGILSSLFMLNTQIGHLHDENLTKEINEDWYKHQIETTSNFATNSYFHYLFSGGLNFQIEHHLFPNINHCHLPSIKAIVKKLCVKHNIKYKEYNGYFDAVKSHIRTLKNIKSKKIEIN